MSFFKGKKILVTGGTGMIGQPLCEMLLSLGGIVTVASLDGAERAPNGVIFKKVDLRSFENCLTVSKGQEIVFHLAGVKGSPKMTAERPASFFVPTLQFSLNMMEAARRQGVERYLLTSSVGVYQPAPVFEEDSVWTTFPSQNDRFAGWAKRMCELQAEAYKIEYGWDKISIVRPANVYGPFDNFDPENAMVIPSLIHRALNEEGSLNVWGDGSPIRDFIHARDVARGMLMVVEKGISEPINLGSGDGVTIRKIAETISASTNRELIWDTTKPQGDAKRVMDMSRAYSLGFKCEVSLKDGINETINWYKNNKFIANARYNSFTEEVLRPS
jgi:GDP-L-fucose synthase